MYHQNSIWLWMQSEPLLIVIYLNYFWNGGSVTHCYSYFENIYEVKKWSTSQYCKIGSLNYQARDILWDSISTLEKPLSENETIEDSTGSIIQGILDLYADTLREAFFHLGWNISYLTDLKKRTVAVEIENRWDKNIIEEGLMTVVKVEYVVR